MNTRLLDDASCLAEVLRVLSRQELRNICRRLRKAGFKHTAQIVSDEIDQRDALLSAGQKVTQ